MHTVIANLKNFTFSHDILVINEEGEIVTKISSSMKDLAENVVEKCSAYNATKVKLLGNKKYATKLEQDIKQLGLTKYKLNFDIEII